MDSPFDLSNSQLRDEERERKTEREGKQEKERKRERQMWKRGTAVKMKTRGDK